MPKSSAASAAPDSPKKEASPSKKKKSPNKKTKPTINVDSLDVILTANNNNVAPGECSLLVQIDPHDATQLDLEGATGAIGRFEAGDDGVTLDLKGYQYHGVIHPGPTAMVLAVNKTGQLKVDALTDEFVTLSQTQDVMAKLDAVVKGNMEGYRVVDDDVNVRSSSATHESANIGAKKPAIKKRKVGAGGGGFKKK